MIVIAICWPPAQGEVDDEDEVFVMCCALRAAVTRASCVREVNAVVRGVPPGGGRPGLLTVTLALRTPFQLVDEPPPHAACRQRECRGDAGKHPRAGREALAPPAVCYWPLSGHRRSIIRAVEIVEAKHALATVVTAVAVALAGLSAVAAGAGAARTRSAISGRCAQAPARG